MAERFLSSEEYDEHAHKLYNDGDYEAALEMLKEGLSLYPNAVELYVGLGYARLAREEFAWARQSYERALVLDPAHEDALVGMGETLLRLGDREQALRLFARVAAMGGQRGRGGARRGPGDLGGGDDAFLEVLRRDHQEQRERDLHGLSSELDLYNDRTRGCSRLNLTQDCLLEPSRGPRPMGLCIDG